MGDLNTIDGQVGSIVLEDGTLSISIFYDIATSGLITLAWDDTVGATMNGFFNESIDPPAGWCSWQGAVDLTNTSPAPVPEPATMVLLGSGLLGLAGFRKKMKK
jgi:hypothetical protein